MENVSRRSQSPDLWNKLFLFAQGCFITLFFIWIPNCVIIRFCSLVSCPTLTYISEISVLQTNVGNFWYSFTHLSPIQSLFPNNAYIEYPHATAVFKPIRSISKLDKGAWPRWWHPTVSRRQLSVKPRSFCHGKERDLLLALWKGVLLAGISPELKKNSEWTDTRGLQTTTVSGLCVRQFNMDTAL